MRGFALLVGLASVTASWAADDLIGRKIADFRLQDFRGGWHELKDVDAIKVVVVAFICTECPLAKLDHARLAKRSRA